MEQIQQDKQPTYNRKEVAKTPFSIYTEIDENGLQVKSVICIGRDRVSPIDFATVDEALAYIEQKEWDLICNCAFLCAVQANEYVKQIKRKKK